MNLISWSTSWSKPRPLQSLSNRLSKPEERAGLEAFWHFFWLCFVLKIHPPFVTLPSLCWTHWACAKQDANKHFNENRLACDHRPLKLWRRRWTRNICWSTMSRISLTEAMPTAESVLTASWPTVSLRSRWAESSFNVETKSLQMGKKNKEIIHNHNKNCGLVWCVCGWPARCARLSPQLHTQQRHRDILTGLDVLIVDGTEDWRRRQRQTQTGEGSYNETPRLPPLRTMINKLISHSIDESARWLTLCGELSVSSEQPANWIHHLPEERRTLTHTHRHTGFDFKQVKNVKNISDYFFKALHLSSLHQLTGQWQEAIHDWWQEEPVKGLPLLPRFHTSAAGTEHTGQEGLANIFFKYIYLKVKKFIYFYKNKIKCGHLLRMKKKMIKSTKRLSQVTWLTLLSLSLFVGVFLTFTPLAVLNLLRKPHLVLNIPRPLPS